MCRRWRAGREGTPMLKVVHDEAEPNEASGSVLDEIVREAARQMLAVALQAEVSAYLDAHAEEVDENGHRLVVRNGHHNEREVITAAGPVPVRAPRVNDKRTDPATGERKRFASAILPAWARKSPRVAEVLPLLYLHGLSSSDFGPALTQFLGTSHGLSAATITRLTKDRQDEATTFNKRSLAGTDYVYCWVDGIHLEVRLEQDNVCLLVMIGVRAAPWGRLSRHATCNLDPWRLGLSKGRSYVPVWPSHDRHIGLRHLVPRLGCRDHRNGDHRRRRRCDARLAVDLARSWRWLGHSGGAYPGARHSLDTRPRQIAARSRRLVAVRVRSSVAPEGKSPRQRQWLARHGRPGCDRRRHPHPRYGLDCFPIVVSRCSARGSGSHDNRRHV